MKKTRKYSPLTREDRSVTRIALPIVALAVLALPLPHAALAQKHGGHDHAADDSPYAVYLDREIKALAPEELDALLAGEGMEMALPAELDGCPGPKHALEMAEPLELTATQVAALEEVREGMLEEARRLGAEIVRLERELDRAFAAATVTEDTFRETPATVGRAGDVALVGATVLAMDGSAPLPDAVVLVRGDRIAAVGPKGSIDVGAARSVDATGGFLVPGLWDMHVHALFDASVIKPLADLFLDHGVTGIRDMGGPLDVLLDARRRIASSEWNACHRTSPRRGRTTSGSGG